MLSFLQFYRNDNIVPPGNFLHIFRISLQFADEPEPFEGVAFIPIPFVVGVISVHDYTFDEQSLDFLDDFIYYD